MVTWLSPRRSQGSIGCPSVTRELYASLQPLRSTLCGEKGSLEPELAKRARVWAGTQPAAALRHPTVLLMVGNEAAPWICEASASASLSLGCYRSSTHGWEGRVNSLAWAGQLPHAFLLMGIPFPAMGQWPLIPSPSQTLPAGGD